MNDKERVAALEAELELRKRTILFLVAEYVSRNEGQRSRVVAFFKEVIPDLPPTTAAIAREMLEAVQEP